MEKIANGVLEIDTPIGSRYVRPNLIQRAFLIWTFRNFFSLPQQVLRPWERALIDSLCDQARFVSLTFARHGMATVERPIIGRVERRAPAQENVPPLRRPATSVTATENSGVGDRGREVASA